MKAAIALLADFSSQNFARRMVYGLAQHGLTKFLGSQLPAHVSLKQPFAFESMETLENWFDALSRGIAPFDIQLDHVYYEEWSGFAIVGLHVVETTILRALHNQINQELKQVVKDSSAAHDGEGYVFHLTCDLGPTENGNPYKAFYEGLPEKEVNLTYQARHIALFAYTEPLEIGSFFCYKVLPLGK